jgi:arsenite-transporting ATPase
MSQIDVEPVEEVDEEPGDTPVGEGAEIPVDVEETEASTELPDAVDAPEYVLYGGKGGVGKTTMAAATALASAAEGTATLVVSTDPAHSLSDTLETDVPPTPTRIRDDVPLFAAEIDPDTVMDGPFADAAGAGGFDDDAAGFDEDVSGFDEQADVDGPDAGSPFGQGDAGPGGTGPMGGEAGPFGDLEELFGGDGLSPFGGPMPGADEAVAMQQLLTYLDDTRFDRVVVDTAPTGHTLRLLELPEVMDSMVGRVMKLRERFRGMMDGVKGLFGAGSEDAGPGLDELEELADRIERLRTVLRDPGRTDFRLVMIPEEMSVVESERLVERLDEFGIPVQTVVVNQVMEDLADVADVDPDWVVSPSLDSCEFCQRRWQVQQRALRRATDLFRGRTVRRVPLLADEVHGEEALRVVAACLVRGS